MARVTAIPQAPSLVQELLYATGVAKKPHPFLQTPIHLSINFQHTSTPYPFSIHLTTHSPIHPSSIIYPSIHHPLIHPLIYPSFLPSIYPLHAFLSSCHPCCLEQPRNNRQVPASGPFLSGMDGCTYTSGVLALLRDTLPGTSLSIPCATLFPLDPHTPKVPTSHSASRTQMSGPWQVLNE